jgi:hypothetical protein
MRLRSLALGLAISALAACSSSSSNNPLTFGLSVTLGGSGGGSVTSSPAGINCGGTCSATFSQGTAVTLTATPDGSSVFTGWSGACTGTSSTCTVTVNAASTVTATFSPAAPTQAVLTVSVGGSAAGTVTASGLSCNQAATSCTGTYNVGDSVTITATPDTTNYPGATASFTGCDSTSGNTCTVSMGGDRGVSVTFSAAPTHTLHVVAGGTGGGSFHAAPTDFPSGCGADCTQTYNGGTVVTLTLTPDASSTVNSPDCDTRSPANPGPGVAQSCVVNMTTDRSVSVTFTHVNTVEVDTVAAQNITLQGMTLSWNTPAGINTVKIYGQLSGGSSFTLLQTVTVAGNSSDSANLTSLVPGGNYIFKLATVDASGTESAGVIHGPQNTYFTGTVADWYANQSSITIHSNNVLFTWSDLDLWFGANKAGGGSMLTANGDVLWIGIDTDPGTDANGSPVTTLLNDTGAGRVDQVIWPFHADYVLQLELTDAANGIVTAALVDPITGQALSSQPGDLNYFRGNLDEVSISRADLGNPSQVRFAFAVGSTVTGWTTDIAPVNINATDVFGFHTSLTSSFAPGAASFDPSQTVNSASVTGRALAPALVTLSVDTTGATITGPVQIMGSEAPLDYTLSNSVYSLAQDSQNAKIFSGTFNMGGSLNNLYFVFADNGVGEPNLGGGKDRMRSLTGAANDVFPTLNWGTVYSATHGFTLTFVLDSGGTPTGITGNRNELSADGQQQWTPSDAFPLTSVGNSRYVAQVAFPAQDLTTAGGDIEWHVIYDGTNWEGGNNHGTDNDPIDYATLSFGGGDGSYF